MNTPQQTLTSRFQLEHFRPGQEAVIQSLLAGRSTLAIFPTGGGKSLCYQLPALLLDGLTIVVSPLIALMKDQVDRLNALNIPAARLDSSLSTEDVISLYDGLDNGRIKLLYIAPERLANERFLARLSRLNISLMAVDEAHCVSEWGHNFRPDYLKLAGLARQLNVGRTLALTATATPKVAEQICRSFDIEPNDHVQTGFYRPNLHIGVAPCSTVDKKAVLLQRLRQAPDQSTIVYVTLQKTAVDVATYLNDNGIQTEPYHAGLKDEDRHRIQDAFMAGESPVVVATIAFGMGIDKSDIRAIYHYNLPKSLENYMQEIGRAGRDGLPSRCELLACRDDLTVLENFTYGDTPDPAALANLMHWLDGQPDEFDISIYELSHHFDVRPLVLNTLLTYLELDNQLHTTAPFYTEYKIAFKEPRSAILDRFDAHRAEFLTRLFNTGKTGRTWLTLKPDDAAQQLGEDKQRIIKALNYLEQQGWIELRVAGVRQGYRKTASNLATAEQIERIAQLFAERETRDIDRLRAICDWAETQGCLQQPLMAYFGETLTQPCGQCSGCQGHAASLPARRHKAPDRAVIDAMVNEAHEALGTPRTLARFLCGITSPKASRARLGKHRCFGALADAPFAEVLALSTQALPSPAPQP
ncbi:RecQ family ATP-dependent DNA helicase [Saccharospirillum salsuginis]|uniref:ATP-dependent DNA helicase RecQ n=1 Tax=Saccharospirillum salsuginis TaxID=418750 RepID=A0A918K3S3_9GAMM|nr:ATP-dependent DNA helicase RecQ [Saccharospirillum salsuginis]GGX47714.1 ATP-dependent DNA helicase RecQ [Saccharospirillum salsuginis]